MLFGPPEPLQSMMMLLGCGSSGAGTVAASYERTAFVSSAGNDGTGALNTLGSPYLTMGAAVTALHAAYAGQTTTLRLLSNLAGGLANSAALNNLLAAGLTIRAHDATVRSIAGAVSFGADPDALLTLSKVTLAVLTKSEHETESAVESAGTITGDADTTINELYLNAGTIVNGANGAAGPSGTGASGDPGSDGDPPTGGSNGSDYDASAGAAGNGSTNKHAWNVELTGSGSCGYICGQGATGGYGGGGGNGGVGTGGNGGAGGNSTSEGAQDGAYGGDGGGATANGSDGGSGGNGGNGSTVIKSAGWTVAAYFLLGGGAGYGGSGGMAGSASGGAGGAGGNGANGGSAGASGATGSTTMNAGSVGADGSVGSDGSII